jgi:hypothetical protein
MECGTTQMKVVRGRVPFDHLRDILPLAALGYLINYGKPTPNILVHVHVHMWILQIVLRHSTREDRGFTWYSNM